MRHMVRFALVLFFAALCASAPAFAQELSLLAGAMKAREFQEGSYAWAFDYRHGLGEHAALTFSWLNEGHVPNHHRDGQTIQLWARTSVLDRRLTLAAGAGPYLYYDTTRPIGTHFSNEHGWGAVFSVSATYYTDDRLFYEFRVNQVVARNSINTTSGLFGIGYQLDAPSSRGPLTETIPQGEKTTQNEVAIFLGQTIVNSFNSERSLATAVEYRRGLLDHVDWTVSWIHEGDARLARRNGVATQLWAVRDAFDRRLAIGAGIGPYLALDFHEATTLPHERERVSALVTASAAFRLTRRAFIRASWNRVLTDDSRDTDVVLIGAGYRF